MKLNDFLNNVFGMQKSVDEFNQLQEWKNAGELNAQMLQEMSNVNDDTTSLVDYQTFNVESALANTLARIDEPTNTSNKNGAKIFIVALLALLLAGIFAYTKLVQSSTTEHIYAENKLQAYTKNDGSQFLLNKQSDLVIDESTNSYKLSGEAFFQVEKQDKPVVITTNHGDITVLGTSFNVVTTEDFTEIYMFSGTISFNNAEAGSQTNLTKGQCIIAKSKGNEIMNDLSDQAFAYWRTNRLEYAHAPLATVIADLNKIFHDDVEIPQDYHEIMINTLFDNNSYDEIIDELEVITGLAIK